MKKEDKVLVKKKKTIKESQWVLRSDISLKPVSATGENKAKSVGSRQSREENVWVNCASAWPMKTLILNKVYLISQGH